MVLVLLLALQSPAELERFELAIVEAATDEERARAYCDLTRALLRSEDPEERDRASGFLDACRSFNKDPATIVDLEVDVVAQTPELVKTYAVDALQELAPRLATMSRHRGAHSAALRRLTDLHFTRHDEDAGKKALEEALERYSEDLPYICSLGEDAAKRYLTDVNDEDGPRASELLDACVDDAFAVETKRAVLLHRAVPFLLVGGIALLVLALVLRWRRRRAG